MPNTFPQMLWNWLEPRCLETPGIYSLDTVYKQRTIARTSFDPEYTAYVITTYQEGVLTGAQGSKHVRYSSIFRLFLLLVSLD